MRAVWVNDIHLDFLDDDAADHFLESVAEVSPDAVLVGGDISTAVQLESHLSRIEERLEAPVFFVLGNHDFYLGSIVEVREMVRGICDRSPRLHWLNTAGVNPLTDKTALVGHDGWGDARLGNYQTSAVELTDFYLIEELRGLERPALVEVLRRLGDEAAEHFRIVLPEALDAYQRLVLLTHVPPFREATWYEGEISNDDWLPFFCCKSAGDALKEIMSAAPDRELTVLCGHTHGEGEVQILPNLRVFTGGARYGHPAVHSILELD
jgi:predicted MPP superfamily phosphohydrolase